MQGSNQTPGAPAISESTPIGPDVDLSQEDIRLADGTRLTNEMIPGLVEEIREKTDPRDVYTRAAVTAITRAARSEHSFAEWLAHVLAEAAGQLGSSDALNEGRPGSWEASLVDQLVKGTVGWGDEYLPQPTGNRKLTDVKVRQIREACDWEELPQRQVAAEFGVAPSTVSDIVTGKTWRWVK